jgi:hypothetical protein
VEPPWLILIHSPVVGPLTWRACSAALESIRRPSSVPSLSGVLDTQPPPWIPKLAERVADEVRAAPAGSSVALVVHSGAGALVPAIHALLGRRVRAAVFVDAVIPRPGRSWFDTAPPARSEWLRGLSRDGVLPPWNEWFPPGSIESHLPDETLRSRFLAELPHVPLAYFAEAPPEATGWEATRCGYLQLSDAYDDAAREADARGWLTHHEHSDHLAMVTHPQEIAMALDRILEQMGVPHS